MVDVVNATTPWQEGNVDLCGLNIHYYRTGNADKPALVVAHGFGDNGLCWRRVANDLQHRFDVIMIDARNHGQSGTAPANSTAIIEDLASVITALNLDKPALLGHSMGASTVAGVAAQYPHLVSKIILEDPLWKERTRAESAEDQNKRLHAYQQPLEAQQALSDKEIMQAGKAQHPTWRADEFPDWAIAKQQVRAEALLGLSVSNWTQTHDLVSRITCPSLLIRAGTGSDGVITAEIATKVVKSNNYFSAADVAGAGHNIRREGFDEYLAIVSTFLE